MITKIKLMVALMATMAFSVSAEKYVTITDRSYVEPSSNAYRNERCKLDIYQPTEAKGFPTVVFFHGGGLEGGNKSLPYLLKERGIAVVSPNYRLSPKAHYPEYIDDAAAAVAWTIEHISEYGGDPKKVYVCGHSAGGYLTLMLALDKSYLQKYGIDADSIAGYVSFSGQTNTHYTIRKERGADMQIPIIDKYAPLYNARKLHTELLLLTGGRDMELLARYTENLHLQEILKAKGNDVEFYELNGFDHGTMLHPGCLLMIDMINRHNKANK